MALVSLQALQSVLPRSFHDGASGRLDHRLEEIFPAAAEVFRVELARLMAKETSPEQFVEAVDAAYRAYLATLE